MARQLVFVCFFLRALLQCNGVSRITCNCFLQWFVHINAAFGTRDLELGSALGKHRHVDCISDEPHE